MDARLHAARWLGMGRAAPDLITPGRGRLRWAPCGTRQAVASSEFIGGAAVRRSASFIQECGVLCEEPPLCFEARFLDSQFDMCGVMMTKKAPGLQFVRHVTLQLLYTPATGVKPMRTSRMYARLKALKNRGSSSTKLRTTRRSSGLSVSTCWGVAEVQQDSKL